MLAVAEHLFARRGLFGQSARHVVNGVAEGGVVVRSGLGESLLGDAQRGFLFVALILLLFEIVADGRRIGGDGCRVMPLAVRVSALSLTQVMTLSNTPCNKSGSM